MEDQFQLVKTWRGYILVSSCLLPSSSAERARIYPDYLDNNHAHTARDATPVAQNQVAQEGNPQLPTPNPYHCYITQVPSRDLQYEKGLLGTPGESRFAAARYFKGKQFTCTSRLTLLVVSASWNLTR